MDRSAPLVQRTLTTVCTGHDIPTSAVHVGTYQMQGGALILHVFDHGDDRIPALDSNKSTSVYTKSVEQADDHLTDAGLPTYTELVQFVKGVALTAAGSNSEPDEMGEALDEIVATAQGFMGRVEMRALEAELCGRMGGLS